MHVTPTYRQTILNYTMPIERKLAAIMFTDIAGYTAQMSKDEAVAISLLLLLIVGCEDI